ncbi:MAG: hypothetical protein ACREDD_10920 [Methylocella sp.]
MRMQACRQGESPSAVGRAFGVGCATNERTWHLPFLHDSSLLGSSRRQNPVVKPVTATAISWTNIEAVAMPVDGGNLGFNKLVIRCLPV